MIYTMLEFIAFTIVVLSLFYIPGKFLVNSLKLELKPIEDIFFSTVLGFLLFTLISYIFSWLNTDFLIVPIFLIVGVLAVKTGNFLPQRIEKKHTKPIFLVLFLAFIFSLPMLSTGKFGDTIMYGRDDLWHLALINELKVNFPPDNPGFAGIPLRGYHFFYNLVLAKISNIFYISPLSLHFHFFPAFLAFLTGIGTYAFVYMWSKKISVSLWAVFLTMFGGSFSYILHIMGREISLTNNLNMSQPIFTLYNPPLASSIIILLCALIAIYRYSDTRKNNWLVTLILSAGLISMFKVYAGMILIGGLAFMTIAELVKKKYTLLIVSSLTAVIFFFTYWVFAGGAGYLIFYPLWPSQKLLLSLPWYGYHEKITTYAEQSVIRGIVRTEAYGLFLFLVGGLGTRIFGLVLIVLENIKKRKIPSFFSMTIIVMSLIAIITPIFFIQSGKVFEIIQMTHYFVFFMSIFAAFGIASFLDSRFNKIAKVFIAFILILLTIPNSYFVLRQHFRVVDRSTKSLSDPYFQAMDFLSRQESYTSIVLELPPKDISPTQEELGKWYSKISNPSIVAFGDKRSFMSNQFIEFPGTDRDRRLSVLKEIMIFNATSATNSAFPELKQEAEESLRINKISFIYVPYDSKFSSLRGVDKIYQSGSHTVYKVD
jgi:hypothetical protein